STDNSLWGNGTKSYSTRASDISLSDWTYQSNNPCPSGWRIPSRWNFWDLYRGTGTDTSISSSNYDGTNNTWVWRAMNTANYAIGGVIITATNAFGAEEKLFLPALGYRSYSSGALGTAGTNGSYWSSTYGNSGSACGLYFSGSGVGAGSYTTPTKADGQSVRCVAEF
ncbi:MAG: hypothetical protein LBB53_01780, partial [Prevotellaceae bacterium]|nr:hypothetical protein [Prevotellaceae bacterium]